ncbi:amino acid permease [Rhodohalobacter mucosus]|uniref:Na-K-Cl cotransporter n=1 Tax=Rhodohalobacter mucosus TaxID=2079485 RepID=A0A316TQD1_9BACT|nr:amino acid permease [Rhodohalobacter mucosus]PWN05881.1 Na-K-Cl cotransporter [Rhodohalobacter mucosus]
MKNPIRQLFPRPEKVAAPKQGGLGTFGGVFTPSILTILGVIMYLRFGWVVGNVGLLGTLIIVTLATSITFLTALSVASIATDQRVRIGGAYYMISRSLGIETGGAIGIPLYIALALSVALYTVGFAESIVSVFPGLNFKLVGMGTTVFVAVLAMISAKVAIRAQYFIMFGIALSLLSLFFGGAVEESTIELWGASERNSESFWVVFAVFFPAVTGIMAGVNMSGDLENPAKSIPKGTFYAIGTGYLIYMILPVILATRADALTLIEDPLVMRRMAYWGDAILIGVWGATLSSAVGSVLGAPRVLQALARDGVLPRWLRWLGTGSGEDDSPRIGTFITMIIALVAVFLGNLNVIAPILTMFFLTTYGVLNASAGIERLLDSPSFRPEFRVHWSFSILGALGCLAVMFLINAVATTLAFIFVIAIFLWLQRREMKTAWGDVGKGLWMALIRTGLLRISHESEAKTWRPNPLVLSGAPTKRWHLIDFANSITHNRGILTIATVLTGSNIPTQRREKMQENIRDFLSKRGIQGLVRVTNADNAFSGAGELVQSYGLGPLVPNTIILGDSENPDIRSDYCKMVAGFNRMGRNVLILHDNDEGMVFRERKRIDLWWGGLKGNGGLMMIVAYLLQSSRSWWGSEVTIKMMVSDEQAAEDARANLNAMIKRLRTGAKAEIIVSGSRTFNEVLHESSAGADLIMMGMAEPDENFDAYYESIQKRLSGLPTTLMVLAGEEISYGDVLLQQDAYEE